MLTIILTPRNHYNIHIFTFNSFFYLFIYQSKKQQITNFLNRNLLASAALLIHYFMPALTVMLVCLE